MLFNLEQSWYQIQLELFNKVEIVGPKILWAFVIILIWYMGARVMYKVMMFLFQKFKLNQLIDKLKVNFDEENIDTKKKKKELKKTRFTDKIKVDDSIAKSIGVFLFLIFFRIAVSYIGITEVEDFLRDLIDYLPNLFIWVLIWFFGIRFANFVYDVIYHTLAMTKEKTSKIIAYSGKIIILFFTLMLFLDYTKIVSDFIINTILIGFVSMLALAGGLAFWLGGKEIASEILESFRK